MKVNPEKEFDYVPESFTEESHLTSVISNVNSAGIIFDDLKEIEFALRVYNGEANVIPASGLDTNLNLLQNIGLKGGDLGIAIGLIAISEAREGKDFVGTIMAEARSNLATKGRYSRHFDYDGMGSSFMKTSVTIEKVKGKFLLSLNAACIGDKPEHELAALLQRPLAIANVRIKMSLSIVDGWWYNANLKNILSRIFPGNADNEQSWLRLAEVLAFRDDPSFKFCSWREGYSFEQRWFMDHPYHRDKDGKDIILVRAINGNVAGAAWNPYSEKNELQEQKLFLSLRLKEVAIEEKERLVLTSFVKEVEDQLLAQVK